ncbi:MAG: hypothetical protein GY745_22090 [Actinomycetia bacterium]|nr:hypothetical protein [Actinomycetes bacterium]
MSGETTMTKQRKALHAYVTADAHNQWHDFAAENGVSVSAILEALAPELDSDPIGAGSGRMDQIIKLARRIDAQRRRRSST